MILLSILATLFFIVVNEPVWSFAFAFAALVLFVRSIYVDKAVYLLRLQEEKNAARQEAAEKLQKQYNNYESSLKERLARGEYLLNIEGHLVLGRYHLNGQFQPTGIIRHGKIHETTSQVSGRNWA